MDGCGGGRVVVSRRGGSAGSRDVGWCEVDSLGMERRVMEGKEMEDGRKGDNSKEVRKAKKGGTEKIAKKQRKEMQEKGVAAVGAGESEGEWVDARA